MGIQANQKLLHIKQNTKRGDSRALRVERRTTICVIDQKKSHPVYFDKPIPKRLINIKAGIYQRTGVYKHPDRGRYQNIEICDEWKVAKNFYKWALENGYSDNLSIDRIDNSKGYYPENCRWVTMKEQGRNRSNNTTYKGKTLSEHGELLGLDSRRSSVITNRIALGWDIEKAVSTPVRTYRKGGKSCA